MKKIIGKLLLISGLLLSPSPSRCQSNIRPDHYWDNPYLITPAYINNQYEATVSVAARKQWVNVDGTPTTLWLTGAYYLEDKRMQLGCRLFQDKIGYTTCSNLSLTYGYSAAINDDWRLNMGISGSYQSICYDLSKIIAVTPGDPSFQKSFMNRRQMNADLGLELSNKIFRLGIASQNIAGWRSNSNPIIPNTNLLYCTYRLCTENIIDYNFGVSEFNNNRLFQHEVSCMAIFKRKEEDNLYTDKFRVGLFYRFHYEIGASFALHISQSLSVIYSYNYNISTLKYNATGTHELILTYRIKPDPYAHRYD
jgi:type IX secretion system PorP/SprF family membrane protein